MIRTVCACVCVFFPFILDIKFVGRTSRGHTGFIIHLSAVRALIFLGRRIQPFLSLVDREVKFCVLLNNDLIVLHPLAFLFLLFTFLVRKIPFAGIELTSQRVRRLHDYGTSELPVLLIFLQRIFPMKSPRTAYVCVYSHHL